MEEIMMLEECPICRGAGMILHEGGWSVQVECVDCSAHTVYMEYDNEEEKEEAGLISSELKGKVGRKMDIERSFIIMGIGSLGP